MASNSFGNTLRITTFGESHGAAMGVVIDGCPAGVDLTIDDINQALALRAPGRSELVSPRTELDRAKILSGVFENKTTGASIAITIENMHVDSSKYEPTKHLLKPGHANYTYFEKYGIYDYRGGGRASARETVCRVAAGAVATKILGSFKTKIQVVAYLKSVGEITAAIDRDITMMDQEEAVDLKTRALNNIIYCPDEQCSKLMIGVINAAKASGDSVGGVVEFAIVGLPVGLGDPVYEKFSAKLASAMFSIPAVKGFEIGEGFKAAIKHGSENNDLFITKDNHVTCASNHAGGLLGGITTGMPIIGRVAFKPTPTIVKPQVTIDRDRGEQQMFQLPVGSMHDPCVAIRAVVVVEAMCALVAADALLINRCAKL